MFHVEKAQLEDLKQFESLRGKPVCNRPQFAFSKHFNNEAKPGRLKEYWCIKDGNNEVFSVFTTCFYEDIGLLELQTIESNPNNPLKGFVMKTALDFLANQAHEKGGSQIKVDDPSYHLWDSLEAAGFIVKGRKGKEISSSPIKIISRP